MVKEFKIVKHLEGPRNRPIIITSVGAVITILLILATLEVSRRNINGLVTTQEKYIISIEAAVLFIFLVEMLVRVLTRYFNAVEFIERGMRLRLTVRITGYSVALLAVVAILSSNSALGISVGAIAGVILALAVQNIASSLLATIIILTTRMVRVGEEITISQTRGIIADITLTHTILSIDDEIVFIPNSLIITSLVRRKKRNSSKDADLHDW
jgi:small-conductance mechanosensitive channel